MSRITNVPAALKPGFFGAGSPVGAWGDYDNDGLLDLYVPNSSSPLYHNAGGGTFTKVVQSPISTDVMSANAAAWGDYDNDGFLDPSN